MVDAVSASMSSAIADLSGQIAASTMIGDVLSAARAAAFDVRLIFHSPAGMSTSHSQVSTSLVDASASVFQSVSWRSRDRMVQGLQNFFCGTRKRSIGVECSTRA